MCSRSLIDEWRGDEVEVGVGVGIGEGHAWGWVRGVWRRLCWQVWGLLGRIVLGNLSVWLFLVFFQAFFSGG